MAQFIAYSIGVFLLVIILLVIILLVAKKYLSPSGNVNIEINGDRTISVAQGNNLMATLNENGIFASIFTGIDYYIYKKLYIGAELGVTFNTGKKKNGNYTEVTGHRESINGNIVDERVKKYSSETGITTNYDGTTTQGPVTETKGTYTKVYIEPSIRIGWMF